MSTQTLCNRVAFEYFDDQLPRLESTRGLVRATIGVSMHALDDVDPEHVEERMRQLAERVQQRVRSRQLQARLAHLHDVLFEEEGYFGNTTNYYSPLNSYLPAVLESRRGIPVTLALLYKAVAAHLGIHVVGLNTPYHFLVQVRDGDERMIVDPFLGGRVLTGREVRKLLMPGASSLDRHPADSLLTDGESRGGDGEGDTPISGLPIATHRQWLARILANLQRIFGRHGFAVDYSAMTELQKRLENYPYHRRNWGEG